LALIIFAVSEKKAFKHFIIKMFQNASSLKPLGQLKPNYPGMIIGRSCSKFMPIGNPRWPSPQDID
jgi:hypothetical protein